jgi:hypothetical protein
MKINWGTGILIFLILFLLAAAGFIYFASQQSINLVHKNYYEKGVDYTEQMNIDARSVEYKNAFDIRNSDKFLTLTIEKSLSEKIDSGSVILFRPSDFKKDILMPVQSQTSKIDFPKKDLLQGRYILKFSWYSNGLKYGIDRPVNVQ